MFHVPAHKDTTHPAGQQPVQPVRTLADYVQRVQAIEGNRTFVRSPGYRTFELRDGDEPDDLSGWL